MNRLPHPPVTLPPASALADLSHELKTPLVALLGFAQLLESDASQPLSRNQRERAERIEQVSREMLALVNDVLAGARAARRTSAVVARG